MKSSNAPVTNFGIKGMHPAVLAKSLLDEDRIWTTGVNNAGVTGVRVKPNVFMQPKELDKLVAAIARYAKRAQVGQESQREKN